MHILFVTASLPYPPHQGGAIRAYGLMGGLHKAGHELTLLSFADNASAAPDDTPLASICQRIYTVPVPERTVRDRLHTLLRTRRADIETRLASDAMTYQLSSLLEQHDFDLVQFEGIEVAPYLLETRRSHPHLPLIYDAFNAEAAMQAAIALIERGNPRRIATAVYSQLQVGRIRRLERTLCQAATAVIAVSDEDAVLLRSYNDCRSVYVVPSGIPVSDYANSSDKLQLRTNVLVFTGKMDYRPNVDAMLWFADEVLPLILQQEAAHLYIVGQKPHPKIAALNEHPNIEVSGWVPAIQPYLQAADVYVAPLRMGSGTRLKMLEAMASGRAIVATNTAVAGLLPASRQHMLVTDDPGEMAENILNLLRQPEYRLQVGQQAQHFVRSHYDWSVIIPRLIAVYEELGLA